MTQSELNLLMHTVLDGEATPEESRALEQHLAADPAARAEFDALARLFDALASIPSVVPPAGLVDSVMARIPQGRARHSRLRQREVACKWTGSGSPGQSPGNGNIDLPGSRSAMGMNSPDRKSDQEQGLIGISIALVAVIITVPVC
jgi:hypothetical protein